MNTKIICNIHNQIISLIQKLYCLEYDDVNRLRNEIVDMADELNRLTNEALEAGQHMEDRLKSYRESIENLGFKRNKNGLIDWQIKHLKEKVGKLSIELNKYKKA